MDQSLTRGVFTMLATLLLGLGMGLLADIPAGSTPEAAPSSADLGAYEDARKTIGRDAAAHVGLALWCEAHGLMAERWKHLARAVLIEPRNATARGLMGLASYRGAWLRPEAVIEKIQSDEALSARLADYNTRRQQMA